MLTSDRESPELVGTHPLFRYARLVSPGSVSLLRYHAIPPWSAIPGPYDAILQFRESFAARVALRSSSSGSRYEFEHASETVSERAGQFLTEHTPVVRYPVATRRGIAFFELEFEVAHVRFTLGPSRISFGGAGSNEAHVECALTTTVVYRETATSVEARRLGASYGPQAEQVASLGLEPRVEEVVVDSTTVRMSGTLGLGTRAERYELWAYVDVSDGVFTLASASALTEDYFDRLATRIQPSFGQIPVTPRVALTGYQESRFVDVDLGQLNASMTVTYGNVPGDKVLHLCIALGAPVSETHLSRVRPFCGEHDYAFYQAGHLTLTILRRRWELLPDEDRTTVVSLDLPLTREGQSVTGRGRIRVRLDRLRETALETMPDRPDFIKALIASNMELLEASDETGHGLDVAALGVLPEAGEQVGIAYFPFATVPRDLPPINRFIDRMFTHLFSQMYAPFGGSSRARLRAVDGHVSTPLGAVFVRASLEG